MSRENAAIDKKNNSVKRCPLSGQSRPQKQTYQVPGKNIYRCDNSERTSKNTGKTPEGRKQKYIVKPIGDTRQLKKINTGPAHRTKNIGKPIYKEKRPQTEIRTKFDEDNQEDETAFRRPPILVKEKCRCGYEFLLDDSKLVTKEEYDELEEEGDEFIEEYKCMCPKCKSLLMERQ